MARSDDVDPARLRREFVSLPLGRRRQVVRAVNRGRAVEERPLAVHAVVLARRQQRLWRWVWVTGPLIGLTQVGVGWQAALAATVVSTLTMALLARYWYGKAVRAESLNLELVPKRQRTALAGQVRRSGRDRGPAGRPTRRGQG